MVSIGWSSSFKVEGWITQPMTDDYQIIERELLDEEYKKVLQGFEAHALSYGNPAEQPERFTFVVEHEGTVIACASGLAYKAETYSNWFYLSDLFVEAAYRGRGIGGGVLRRLEEKVRSLGIKYA